MADDAARGNRPVVVLDHDNSETPRARDRRTRVRSPASAILSRAGHPNTLVIGSSRMTGAAVARLLPYLQGPVAQWDPRTCAEPPAVAQGALVIWNVDKLDGEAQRHLLNFSTDRGRGVQLISVCSTALFERVWRGEFLETLYYHLDIVRVSARGYRAESLTTKASDRHE